MWRMLGVLAALAGFAVVQWMLGGGFGRTLRGARGSGPGISTRGALHAPLQAAADWWRWIGSPAAMPLLLVVLASVLAGAAVGASRWRARHRRRYIRLQVDAYRTDHCDVESVVRMFDALHKRLQRRWWRRLLHGQPSVALEVHHTSGRAGAAAHLAVACQAGSEAAIEAALRGAYPNCSLRTMTSSVLDAPVVMRLKKRSSFINRVNVVDPREREWKPPVDRLITVMAASGESCCVQYALTPAPAIFESLARHFYRRHEASLARRRESTVTRHRSLVEDAELKGALELQHRALFFAELRVVGETRETCELIASELRVGAAENRLVERDTRVRHGFLDIYSRRVRRGEGNPVPSFDRGVFATVELAGLWQLPSIEYATVPFARTGLPVAPAPPGIHRPSGRGTLRDAAGAVSVEVSLRKQNTAVPGTVEQGKSSYLVATVAEDIERERCAVIVLDPKGDAADAAVSVVPVERRCTVLDFAHPTCGFNPLTVDAPADVIADYVVAALKNLFTDADIRASSDRYLRNAIIAVLAHDRSATLWDAARLLSVGEEGYSYRNRVGARIRGLPAYREISAFFTDELSAQLADSRSTTTAKLDAPVNKLARLLNSPSIKRILLNDSLRVDFDRVIAESEVLIVKGALGVMGAGNTSVLMQLLLGMLDAALARQQDLATADRRVAVALKIDEAPLVVNRGFAETMALKRSAGLETVACWQTDAQWVDRDVREQLDALFAHRVYFATASAADARSAVGLTMAQFSDSVRPGMSHLSSLGHPDVRLHLPRHHAIVSWSTGAGRQPAFIAQTVPMAIDRERIASHAARQCERGARHLTDFRQPHWDRPEPAEQRASSTDFAPGRGTPIAQRRGRPPHEPSAEAGRTAGPPPLPSVPAAGFRELIDLDRAQSARARRTASVPLDIDPDELDLEVLALIATLAHVLTSQIHRHFNPTRATTTTQRRLKRLADAGLIERVQFHRRDGGGVPMCCALTARGLQLLVERDSAPTPLLPTSRLSPHAATSDAKGARRLRQAVQDVHVGGWMLAVGAALGSRVVTLRGPGDCVLAPPSAAGAPLGPSGLRLGGGRTPHEFLRTDANGIRIEVERFETVRPDGVLTVEPDRSTPIDSGAPLARGLPTDVIIERDDRLLHGGGTAKLERYDHFLAGWAAHTSRYGGRMRAAPLVVFICRDRRRARECARGADRILSACQAYAGEYPFDWDYPGRRRIVFVAERDAHEGLLCAYGVPDLPPEVRVAAGNGDPAAAESDTVIRVIPTGTPVSQTRREPPLGER